MNWYSATIDLNLVNEVYEQRKRIERSRGMIGDKYGKYSYQLKGIKSWKRTWIFNDATLDMKPAK